MEYSGLWTAQHMYLTAETVTLLYTLQNKEKVECLNHEVNNHFCRVLRQRQWRCILSQLESNAKIITVLAELVSKTKPQKSYSNSVIQCH